MSTELGLTPGFAVTEQRATAETWLIEEALHHILESAPFHNSKQCQDLLRYVVQHSLSGEDNLLRERVIGTTVFGREPDYDTANDPIVRARMAEVRKRLAQYYQSAEQSPPVAIEILPGHYLARFRFSADTAPAPNDAHHDADEASEPEKALAPVASTFTAAVLEAPPRSRRFRTRFILLALLVLLLAGFATVVAVRSLHPRQETAFDRFWMPAMKSTMPVLIYTGTNVVYRFSPEFLDRYRRMHHLENNGPEFNVDLKTAGPLDARDLTISNNAFVTTGDVTACATIVSMLVRHGKPYELRYAGDISHGDVHSTPVVLIGAFNNSWTLNVTNPLRFTFSEGNTILDRYDKSRSWAVRVSPNGTTTDDYAIISRLLGPNGGESIMTAAGIGHYGTQAASEFLSDPEKISDFARTAPAGWDRKNLQIVMHVKVVDESPVSSDIVAVHYW